MNSDNLYTQFDNVFFEKTRLSMMTIIYKEDVVSFNRIKKIIGGSDGAIYTHLKKLISAEYITQKKELTGNKAETFYSMTNEGKILFKKYIKFLEEIVK